MNYSPLFERLRSAGYANWVDQLQQRAKIWFSEQHHGDCKRWSAALQQLPDISDIRMDYQSEAVSVRGECDDPRLLERSLQGLMPWRKGPYRFTNVHIDSEWRSNYKWDRVQPHLQSLAGRRVLDVGCGNGYYAWRMLAQDPQLVVGIDPSVLFNLQFQAVQRYARDPRIYLLPITLEHMPKDMPWFDSVFSMGVLYHRRSPLDHLLSLKSLLRPGGELCLETLVIPGGLGQVLVPRSRYARMNNVWFLPSADELVHWMQRCGFINCRVVDINRTGVGEQRSTPWMTFESLEQCLDENNPELTIEGYPAPMRAAVLANREAIK